MSTMMVQKEFKSSPKRNIFVIPAKKSLDQRVYLLEQYMKGFSGYDPDTIDPKSSGVEHSLFLSYQLNQLSTKSSVVFEPPIERKDRLQDEMSTVLLSSKHLAEEFNDLVSRLRWHTELCKSLRTVRKTAETEPRSDFFRAVVDIHDCVRTIASEDMSKEMANVIESVINALSPSMTRQDLLEVTDKLFAAGLRTWSRPKIIAEEVRDCDR